MAAIIVDGISIEIPIYGAGASSLRHTILGKAVGGRFTRLGSHVIVNALQNISFEARDGDRIGLVGSNGSGKTTLLRALAGIYPPTAGAITIRGRVSPLLDSTLGMSGDATGLENIRICCALWGLSREQTEGSIADISEFTELGDYLDMPVRTYSTGMQLRLAFGIATVRDPEILLLDEVIGAGDAMFFQKALARLIGLVQRSRVFIVASHSDVIIRQLCNKVLWLRNGVAVAFGEVEETIQAYHDQTAEAAAAAQAVVSTTSVNGMLPPELWKAAGLEDSAFDLTREVLSAIEQIGFQPFIFVGVRTNGIDSTQLVCRTQNDTQEFLARLVEFPWFPQSRLLQAIERALLGETTVAAELVVRWVDDQHGAGLETAQTSLPRGIFHPAFVGYPAFHVGPDQPTSSPTERRRTVLDLVAAYARVPGNDAARFAMLDAFALAASRISQTGEDSKEALAIIKRASLARTGSPHIMAAMEALVPANESNFQGSAASE